MKLPNFSNLTEKYKNLSNDLNLNEKLSKISNAVEAKYSEISDAIDLDEKLSKASNAVNNIERKCANISDTFGLDETLIKISNILDAPKPHSTTKFVPKNTIPAFPAKLPDCKEIAAGNHKDPRVLICYLRHFDMKSPFSDENFNEWFIEDAGDAIQILEILKNKKWIQETDQVSVLMTLYTADELKTFLQSHELKVSGKKEELAKRLLEKVPFKNFKRRYKHTLYNFTELGLERLQEKGTDYNQAVADSVNALKTQNIQNVVEIYNLYDSKWGFLHANNKPYTIFSNCEIPCERFNYIASHPMHELQNSDKFKKDLCAFLLTTLMRRRKNYVELEEEFMRINQEPICCPSILELYKRNRNDDLTREELNRIIAGMHNRIKENPNHTLGYYISKILYDSKHA